MMEGSRRGEVLPEGRNNEEETKLISRENAQRNRELRTSSGNGTELAGQQADGVVSGA
jgi:hypothetical protein